MDIKAIIGNEKNLKIMTGLTQSEFQDIQKSFIKRLDESKIVSGRPAKLGPEGALFLMLFYYRHYVTYELASVLFSLNPSNIKRWVDKSESILQSVLKKKNLCHLIPKNLENRLKGELNPQLSASLMALNNL